MKKLLCFSTTGCYYCDVLKKVLKRRDTTKFLKKAEIEIEFIKYDKSFRKYRIVGFPTLVLLDENEKEISRAVGALDKKELQEWLEGKS